LRFRKVIRCEQREILMLPTLLSCALSFQTCPQLVLPSSYHQFSPHKLNKNEVKIISEKKKNEWRRSTVTTVTRDAVIVTQIIRLNFLRRSSIENPPQRAPFLFCCEHRTFFSTKQHNTKHKTQTYLSQ
jgi:hypothetical protein